jgi:hypothetical protein
VLKRREGKGRQRLGQRQKQKQAGIIIIVDM